MGAHPTSLCAAAATRAWRAVRRPSGLVERTRWLFWLAALLSLVITVPGALGRQDGPAVGLVLVASLVCALVWCRRYALGRAPLAGDLAEAGAVLLLAAAAPAPAIAFGITFSATWQRAVYGRAPRGALYIALVVSGLAASLLVWPHVPGHDGPVAAAPLLGALPTSVLVFVIARHLGGSIFARERASRRQEALTALGLGLMGVRDREQAYALAWRATEALCAATPGLRALTAQQGGRSLTVMGSAGAFRALPHHLLLPEGTAVTAPFPPSEDGDGGAGGGGAAGAAPVTAGLAEQLDAAVGARLQWSAHPLPEMPDGWMVLGAPGRVPEDAHAAVWSVNHQVALAARNVDARAELVRAAQTDPLTGLPNRAAFAQALAGAAGSGEGFAVLFCDLDGFKVVNDGLGHDAGDAVLREVAARLRAATREGDTCARLGGDEFAALLRSLPIDGDGEDDDDDDGHDGAPDALVPAALAVARRVQHDLSQPVLTGERWAGVAVSVGVATGRGPDSAASVVQQADVAMYAAKRGALRVQVFTEELHGDLDDAGLAAELRTAALDGQLRVHYQPVVSLAPGGREDRCEAVEALVRWQHPGRGLLGPDRFITLAERCGAIDDVGAWVLGQACRDAARWQRPGAPVEVHVNVSPLQLRHPGFTGTVAHALACSGLEPQRLVLEVTESAVADGAAQREVLAELHRLGVQVALDDFGTGYSSLATLRHLPVDVLKIDRSFVTDCDQAPNAAVLRAVVGLAEGLGLRTVAEGVETPAVLERLRELGVHAVQGYLLQRPAPLEELGAWLPLGPHAGDGDGADSPVDAIPEPRRSTAEAPTLLP
ncbi:putative bifunctional diguanylate cyclase/phosphodiesterase [Quadrisphaera sp. KR29]|uniref:putative bifunctional diguanylate cyclase/phosphodiesterase n=1 Tax=Quadrisphaera sp. KR29 TaxID=3461391 RepID=UPI0040450E81